MFDALDRIAKEITSKGSMELDRPPRLFRIPKIHRTLIDDPKNKYIVIKGGRGGFKTMSFIASMIEDSYFYHDCTFVFAREIAKSIEDSVYAVVKDLVNEIDVMVCDLCRDDGMPVEFRTDDFKIGKQEITNRKTNVRFRFTGLRSTGGKTAMSQINRIKGTHKARLIMLEEGQDLSEDTLNTLFATANRKGTIAPYRPRQKKKETAPDDARFFVAMNPNKEIDPIISKVQPFIVTGQAVIAHINMMDISGQIGDYDHEAGEIKEVRDTCIIVNEKPVIIQTEPDLQDLSLLAQMDAERGTYAFKHTWEGAAYHKFAGLPFSTHTWCRVAENDIEVIAMWLDPSYKGGDYSAVCCIGRRKSDHKVVAFGRAWKSAWNMKPAIDGIVEMYRRWKPNKFWYEDNGTGYAPQQRFAAERVPAIGITTLMNKEDKIYQAAAYTINMIHFAENLCCPIWVKLIKEYNDEAEYDDPPDSFASLVQQAGIIKEKINY